MAHFGLKYYAEMRSKFKGVLWRVEIAERGYYGANEEMDFSGDNPLQITWENRGDEFFVPVKASEASITIMCHENFHYIGLFTSDPRKFRVSIFRNGGLYWRGFVVADSRRSTRTSHLGRDRHLILNLCMLSIRETALESSRGRKRHCSSQSKRTRRLFEIERRRRRMPRLSLTR